MKILVTGATSGLGAALARSLSHHGAQVWGTGRDRSRLAELAEAYGLPPVVLDHSRLEDVAAAAADLPRFDAIVCNAGVQVVSGHTRTAEGIEETVAVNHLSHLALLDTLLARGDAPGTLVFIGSATHDPDQWTGSPPPDESGLEQVAYGEPGTGTSREGLTRYTTTKLMAVATAQALARELPDTKVLTFDPGLMLDTRLGRQHPVALRAMYRSVLRGVRFLPFASTSARSGRALAEIVLDPSTLPSGAYVDHRRQVRRPSTRALDLDYQQSLLTDSRRVIAHAKGRA